MRTARRLWLSLLCFLLLPQGVDAVVCRLSKVKGFDAEYARAKPVVGGNVSSLEQMKVYVTARGDDIYLQGNYVTQGADYPTKVADNPGDLDMGVLVYNLVGQESESGVSGARFSEAYRNIPLYFDERFVNSSKFRNIDLAGNENLFLVSDGKERRAYRLDTEQGSKWFAEYAPHILGDADTSHAGIAESLAAMPFVSGDVRILSLTTNTSTKRALEELVPAANRIAFDFSTIDRLKALLVEHRGKTILQFGHIEGTEFVTHDAAGQVIFRIPVEEFKHIAAECCQITVFAFGCNSARTGGDGVVGEFNTVDAVHRFAGALTADSYLSFFQKLAGEGERSVSFVINNYTSADGQEEAVLHVHRGSDKKALREVVADAPPAATVHIYRPIPAPPQPPQPIQSESTTTDVPGTAGSSNGSITCLYVFAALLVIGVIIYIARRAA